MNLAVAQVQSGELDAARKTLAGALRLNPDSRRAKELLARLSDR